MIRAIGVDAAFAHMGFARVVIRGTDIHCENLKLVSTSAENQKTVRKSSDGLRRAQELHRALQDYAQGAAFAFVEIPHGGALSASAARAMGMAVGIIASCPIPIIEVSPMEVKAAVTGTRKGAQASKAEIIQWAAQRWPYAPWLRHSHGGKTFKKGDLQNGNEHLADALAIIVAGIATPEFQRALVLMPKPEKVRCPECEGEGHHMIQGEFPVPCRTCKGARTIEKTNATTSPDRQRPASRRIPLD